MSSIKPAISVAVVTRNRPESLARTLESLREQSEQPYEVVVSDDSDDQQAVKTREIATRYHCRYLVGPKRGLYANRNCVALACTGTHIRTMDDDHTFPDEHFALVQKAIDLEPDIVHVVGETHALGSDGNCDGILRLPGQLHPRGFSDRPLADSEFCGISCGASVYPRRVFDLGYRNAEYFKLGHSYLEFGCLLVSKKMVIKTIKSTYVIHHLGVSEYRRSEILEPARLFAILCMSFCHQPSYKNKLLTSGELVLTLLKHPTTTPESFRAALIAFRHRCDVIARLPAFDRCKPSRTPASDQDENIVPNCNVGS